MIQNHDPILVMGAGSIGERYLYILQKLAYTNIWVYRQRNDPLRNIDKNSIHTFTDLSFAAELKPKAAIVCTPTYQHPEQTLFCIERGIHVLVEKPLAHDLTGFDRLYAALLVHDTCFRVGYMLRFHPLFQKLKSVVDNKIMGNLISMQTYWGEYLPDWHPWEDYRLSYAAGKNRGGGAALTLSHDIDLVNWLAGSSVSGWHNMKNFRSALETDVESGADISIAYQNGVTAHCHLNFYEKAPKRWYRFVFDEGSVELDYYLSAMTTYHRHKITVETIQDFDRNLLYESQLLSFFKEIGEGNYREAALRSLNESKMIITICQ
jgi:predicted dehydrogenase